MDGSSLVRCDHRSVHDARHDVQAAIVGPVVVAERTGGAPFDPGDGRVSRRQPLERQRGVGAGNDGLLEAGRGGGEVLGEEAGNGDRPARVAGARRCRAPPPARPWRGRCRRRRGRTAADRAWRRPAPRPGSSAGAPPIKRVASASAATASPSRSPMRPNSGRLEARTSSTVCFSSRDVALDHLAAFQRQLARDEVDGLDAVGALVDRQDARVAIDLRRAGLLDEAHAAVHLHADRGHLAADVGGEGLGDRA